MKERTREDPAILAAAERQMHAWVLGTELKDRALPHLPDAAFGPKPTFITISRESGTCASDVGRQLGERLGWNVFDRNLLDQIASRYHLPRTMLDLVDETPNNWAYDVLGVWMDRKLLPHDKYVAYLSRVVLAAARRGHAVFVGRGAQFLLPRDEVLAVRLIAPLKYRAGRIAERKGIDEAAARRFIAEVRPGSAQVHPAVLPPRQQRSPSLRRGDQRRAVRRDGRRGRDSCRHRTMESATTRAL